MNIRWITFLFGNTNDFISARNFLQSAFELFLCSREFMKIGQLATNEKVNFETP